MLRQGAGGGRVEQHAVVDHGCRALAVFLGRLKDKLHRALPQLAMLRQHARNAQPDRGVRIVAAGVHGVGLRRAVWHIDHFVDGQRVHVKPNQQRVRAGCAAVHHADHAGFAHTGLHLVARTNVVARAPNPPLFAVWTLAFGAAAEVASTTLTLRDKAGNRTAEADALRGFSGIP